MSRRETRYWRRRLAPTAVLVILCLWAGVSAGAEQDDEKTAVGLANLLLAARDVIAGHQDRINDPDVANKGLTGEVVLAEALVKYRQATGENISNIDRTSRYGRTLATLKDAIVHVTDEHQPIINMPGIGFKGLVASVYARLVSEWFGALMRGEAALKVTADSEHVRNRKAGPDPWEAQVLETNLSSPDWPAGEPFMASTTIRGQEAFRILIPQYYRAPCLECHGQPKGELDITGFPKEGAEEGALAGAISVTLFR